MTNQRCLFIVEGTFKAGGLMVLLPGIPRNTKVSIRIGDQIELRGPGRSPQSAEVRGVEMGGPVDHPHAVAVSEEAGDVPPGTEVWTTNDED